MILTLKIFINGVEHNIDVSEDTVTRELLNDLLEETDSGGLQLLYWELRLENGQLVDMDKVLNELSISDGDILYLSPIPGCGA